MLKSPYRETPTEEAILPGPESPLILELEKIQASTRTVRQILTTLHEQNLPESSQNPDHPINESMAIAANRQRLKEILLKESLVDHKNVAEIQKIFGRYSEIYKKMVQAQSAEISEEIIENFLDSMTISSLGLTTRGQILKVAGKRELVDPDHTEYILDLLGKGKNKFSKEFFSKTTLAILGATIVSILLCILNKQEFQDSRNYETLIYIVLIMSVGMPLCVAFAREGYVEEGRRKRISAIRKKLFLGKNVLTDAQFTQLKSELRIQLNEWEKYNGADQKVKKPAQLTPTTPKRGIRVLPVMEEFETPESPVRVAQLTGLAAEAEAAELDADTTEAEEQQSLVLKK